MKSILWPLDIRKDKILQLHCFVYFLKKLFVYLFPTIVHHSLRIFEHLLSPKLEKVGRIRIEFQPIFAILSEKRNCFQLKTKKYGQELLVLRYTPVRI